jgi:hypothetical protein
MALLYSSKALKRLPTVLIYRFIYHIALYTYRSDLNRKERTIKKEKTEQLLQGKERVFIPSLLSVLPQRAQARFDIG